MRRDNRGSERYTLPIETLERRVLASQAPWSPAMLEAEAHTGAALVQNLGGPVNPAPHVAAAAHARPSAASQLNLDFPTFVKMVKPLRNGLGTNAPMVLWGWPGPPANMSLDAFVQAYAARGIIPQIPVGPGYNPVNTIAFAKALEAANMPVYLVFPKNDLLMMAYQNATIYTTYTDSSGTVYKYPCAPLIDASIGAAWVQAQLAPLQDAGIHVTGVVFDDENLPIPIDPGEYQSQKDDPTCASYYPPGALDTFENFIQYIYQLRSTLEGQIMADPVQQMFPGAVVGDFGAYQSSAAVPYVDVGGNAYPPRQSVDTNMLVPALYNQAIPLAPPKSPAKATQKWADDIFFTRWLQTLSTAAVNRGDNQIFSFVSSNIPGFWNVGNLKPLMSRNAYREALRHLWLRGTNSLWLFAGGGGLGTTAGAFQMMDDSRAVYDGLLAYRNFLSQGTPMNVTPPDPSGTQPIWSGLKLGDQALVRTYSPSGKAGRVTIEAFPGVSVKLPAPAAGAGFLITSTGHVRRVKM